MRQIIQIIPAAPGLLAIYENGETEPVEAFALVQDGHDRQVVAMVRCDSGLELLDETGGHPHLERK